MSNKSNKKFIIIALLLLCVAIAVVPLVTLGNSAAFGGSDDAAGDMITSIDSNYTPWFTAPFEKLFAGGEIPGEIESLLFCLQAAAGSGIFFFVLGRLTMRAKMRKALEANGVDVSKADPIKAEKGAVGKEKTA